MVLFFTASNYERSAGPLCNAAGGVIIIVRSLIAMARPDPETGKRGGGLGSPLNAFRRPPSA
jgi:hypothetical protein